MSSYQGDISILDTESMTWRKITPKGDPPQPRRFHGMTILNVKLYIFGGKKEDHQFEDLAVLNLGVLPLSEQCFLALMKCFDRVSPNFDQLPTELLKRLS